MKEGDIIEWNGVSRVVQGTLVRDEEGDLVCQLPNGCSFPLNDLRYSKSAELIET